MGKNNKNKNKNNKKNNNNKNQNTTKEHIKSIDYEVLNGKGVKLLFPYIERSKLPPISIITPTRNRRSVFELTVYQFLNFDYPRDKIQWVILDNGTDKIKDLLPLKGNNIKYMTLDGEQRYNLGDLRNHCIKHCDNDIIVYMDDDDYYPKETIYARVMALIKYLPEGIECVGTVTGMGYNIITGDVQILSNGDKYLMEASLCHTKKFWLDRGFKKTNIAAEYEYFLKKRNHKIRKIPFQFVCIPLNHKINVTDRGNRQNENYDGNTQIVGKLNQSEDINNNGTTRNNILVNKIFSKEIIDILERVKYIQIKEEFEKNMANMRNELLKKDAEKDGEKDAVKDAVKDGEKDGDADKGGDKDVEKDGPDAEKNNKNKDKQAKNEKKIINSKKIGFIIPVTSNKRDWSNIEDIYLFKYVIQSLVITSHKELTKNKIVFYIGIDRDDKIYDNPVYQNKFRKLLEHIIEIQFIYLDTIEKGYLTKMWNLLFKVAYDDGCDYFFQCGDDVEFLTYNWISDCVYALKKMGNKGLTGPRNENPNLLTQSFVSRNHMDLFNKYFSEDIKNWFCDDWINDIYRKIKKYKPLDNHKCVNMGGEPRYNINNDNAFSQKFAENMAKMKKYCDEVVEKDFKLIK